MCGGFIETPVRVWYNGKNFVVVEGGCSKNNLEFFKERENFQSF